MFEQITDNGVIIAIIITSKFTKEGIEFFTPNDFSQQLGYMNRSKGYKIEAHSHKRVQHAVLQTHEVLYVKSGKVKIELYNDKHIFIEDRTLSAGDVILLASGGHSIEMMEDSELIEIKQGPYSNDDKISFTPLKNNDERKFSSEI